MSNTIINVENLSKKYILNHQSAEKYNSLRDVITQKTKNIFGSKNQISSSTEEFWALNDVSFEIKQGDRFGIIGRNGAGKSTLLKILSRIVSPTKGRITIDGRVASLLEVGTGFHPELSGRENVFLNGSILGMNKAEIQKKFDEIVAFAEVEKFLDTPVKRYSSGMYVRLAFAVAAHLEPEILIVDEVLAVGDSVFQKKCIDRMTAIGNEGRTIIFVSHNFASIDALCTSAILLEAGKLIEQGSVSDVIQTYNKKNRNYSAGVDLESIPRLEKGAQKIIFSKIVFDEMPITFGNKIKFSISLKSNEKRSFSDIDFGVNIHDKNQSCIIHISNRFINKNFTHKDDSIVYNFEIDNNLRPGFYQLTLFLRTEDVIQDVLNSMISFEIADGNPYGFNDASQFQGTTLPLFSITQK